MPISPTRPLAILYEHPTWFEPLFAELGRQDVPYEAVNAREHALDPSSTSCPYGAVLNRMSASAWLRGDAGVLLDAKHWLEHLWRLRVPVVNGLDAYKLEISKAAQLELLERLDLPHPESRIVRQAARAARAARAAEGLRFPVVVKPNVGGTGAGIVEYTTPEALARAASSGAVELGVDGSGLVQEKVPTDGTVVRIEVLGDDVLYAIRTDTTGCGFNVCPADLADPESAVEAFEPPDEIVAQALGIAAAGRIDVAGIEYLVDARTGQHLFFDINVLSNYVSGAERVVGFDPWRRLVAWVVGRVG